MLTKVNPYCSEVFDESLFENTAPDEIEKHLAKYLEGYNDCFIRSQQIRYFEAFETGLLSNLDRKSIEPIALSFFGRKRCKGNATLF